jgi:hypothetical protein
MASHVKTPLDNRVESADDGRKERFAEIERRSGATIGQKEKALTRNARAEDDSSRAKKFVEIDRKG